MTVAVPAAGRLPGHASTPVPARSHPACCPAARRRGLLRLTAGRPCRVAAAAAGTVDRAGADAGPPAHRRGPRPPRAPAGRDRCGRRDGRGPGARPGRRSSTGACLRSRPVPGGRRRRRLADPAAIAKVAAAHGARWCAARPTAARLPPATPAWRTSTTELVAFVDSDCVPGPGWIDRLAAHFADPHGRRGRARMSPPWPRPTVAGTVRQRRPEASTSATAPGPGGARRTGAYVPTAALIARRGGPRLCARRAGGFDPALR